MNIHAFVVNQAMHRAQPAPIGGVLPHLAAPQRRLVPPEQPGLGVVCTYRLGVKRMKKTSWGGAGGQPRVQAGGKGPQKRSIYPPVPQDNATRSHSTCGLLWGVPGCFGLFRFRLLCTRTQASRGQTTWDQQDKLGGLVP